MLLALAAGLLVWYRANAACTQAQWQALFARAGQQEAGLAFGLLSLEEQPTLEGPYPLFGLRWIQFSEENDGPHYALFLPGAARNTGLKVLLGGGALLLDGEALRQGQALLLAPGEHLLTAQDGPEPGREWEFVVLYGSRIPCAFLETASGSLEALYASKEHSESASLTLLGADGSPEYTGAVEGMHGRGNITWDYPEKKSFQLKLPQKTSLLGMPAARRWLLISNVYDKSLLRNQTVFAMARRMGMHFVPRSHQIELYINGEYRGCYLLCEKIEVGSGRVELPKLGERNQRTLTKKMLPGQNPPTEERQGEYGLLRCAQTKTAALGQDVGYLLELELTDRFLFEGGCGFISRQGQAVSLKSPSEPSQEQVEYIAGVYQRLEDLLYPPKDGVAQGALEELIDLHSFAQKYLIEELCKNLDANSTSQYFYKQPDSADVRLFAGPVWDYDKALASEGFVMDDLRELAKPAGWWAARPQGHAFWPGLCRRPEFRVAVRQSFFEELMPVAGQMLAEGWVCADARRLADSAAMDALRWQGGDYDPDAFPKEYLVEAEKIETFLAARMAWLQAEWQAGE